MSYTKRQDDGGGGNNDRGPSPTPPPLSISLNCTSFPIDLSCLIPPPTTIIANTSTIQTLITILSLTTISTSTISSDFISTFTTLSLSVTPVILPPDATFSAALTEETALLKKNNELTKGNLATSAALGSIAVLMLLSFVTFVWFWRRRWRAGRSRDPESPPLMTRAGPARPVPSIRSGSGPFVTQDLWLATSRGVQGSSSAPIALRPNSLPRLAVPKRSASAPNITPPSRAPRTSTLRGLPDPAIHFEQSSSSTRGQDPLYHEALQEGADEERNRRARRLGMPIIERTDNRPSVSTIGSELERFAGGGNGGNTPARQGNLHSTRASSGIFPGEDENEEEDGEQISSNRPSKASSKKSAKGSLREDTTEE